MIKIFSLLATIALTGCAVYPVQPYNTVVQQPVVVSPPVVQQPVVVPAHVYRSPVIYAQPRIYSHHHSHANINIRW